MVVYTMRQYPSLIFSKEAFEGPKKYKLSEKTRRNIFEALDWLNEYGTDPDFTGKKISNTGRNQLWELRIKGESKTEWRFLFKRIPNPENPEQPKYAIIHFFQKKTKAIEKRDFDAALRIAKREGW